MKNALISPIEPIENFDGTTGYRVAEVENEPFEMSQPYFWVECDDSCVADFWYYNNEINECVPKPIEPLVDANANLY